MEPLTPFRMKGSGAGWDGPDDPNIPRDIRRLDYARRVEWWKAFVKRWQVVAVCTFCDRDLIEEEMVAHRNNHVREQLRPHSRSLSRLPQETRVELLALFCPTCGALDQAEPHRGH